jgi:FlaG/FlaF family flagellin (archaellin)
MKILKQKNILKQKKGIDTIIAVLLMIVITVAAAVITYIWIMGYIGGTMGGVKTATTQSQISLDMINETTTSSGKFTVIVRNTGSINATVSNIYIGTSSSNLVLVSTTVPGLPKSIAISSTQTFLCTVPSLVSYTPGSTYVIKVVDTDGQSATGTLST